MKVAMVVFGALSSVFAFASELAELCELDVYYNGHNLDETDPSMLQHLPNNFQRFRFMGGRLRDPRNVLDARKTVAAIGDGGYDVIHIQEQGTLWMALWWRQLEHLPLVITLHNPHSHRGIPWMHRLHEAAAKRFFLPRAQRVIVFGQELRAQALELGLVREEERVVVMRPGSRLLIAPKAAKEAPSGPRRRVLCAGTILDYKGIDVLIRAEKLLRERLDDFEIAIVGRCEDWGRYQALIEPGGRFHLDIRYVSGPELVDYLRSAAVVVLPYRSASQSGVIPLAYSHGVPVIATRVGGLPELVEDGETGLLIAPGDESALADAIERVLGDPALRDRMAANAKRYAEEQLDWAQTARDTIAVYAEVLAAAAPSAGSDA